MKMKKANATELSEYLKLPKEERQSSWGWYYEPHAYRYYGFDDPRNGEFEDYFKQNYPIQYFFRNFIETISWVLKIRTSIVSYHLSNFFFHKQRWLKIDRSWCDKTELIPDLIFQCLIHFVEEEKGIEITDWKAEGYDHTDKKEDLKRAYRYAKYVRKPLEEKGWNCNPRYYRYFSELYFRCEKHYCKIVINNLEHLWT